MRWALVRPKANKPASRGSAGSGLENRTGCRAGLLGGNEQVSKPLSACLALRKRGSCFRWVPASLLVLGL